jgi:hypothetical protein
MATTELFVDSFSNRLTGWSKVGSSPYLGVIDYPTNYIAANADGSTGDYGFTDSADLGTITKVEVSLYTRWILTQINNSCSVYLKNNGTWVYVGDIFYSLLWTWKTFDVTSTVNLTPWTWTKVNAALMYLVFDKFGLETSGVQIDAAKLIVTYTTVGGPPKQEVLKLLITHSGL